MPAQNEPLSPSPSPRPPGNHAAANRVADATHRHGVAIPRPIQSSSPRPLPRGCDAGAPGRPRALSSLPRHAAAAAPSPAIGSPPDLGKVLGHEPTSHLSGTQFLPRWFSTVASNGSPMQNTQVSEVCKLVAGMGHSDAVKATEGAFPKVAAFSPLEAAIAKPRSSPLTSESSKVRRSELLTGVTFYMIPTLLLSSRNSFSTSLMVAAVYHQIYMFHKEIFLQAASAGHGKGHHRVLRFGLSSPS